MAELKEQVAKALTDENYELGRTCIFSAHWPSPPPLPASPAEELNSELEEGSVEHECVIADHCLTAVSY